MENNIVEELNHNIEKVNEVTEENLNKIEESIIKTEETTEEITNEVNETVEQVEETINEVEKSTNEIEETKEEVTEEFIGKIIEFEKLYVRKEASKYSEPVGIVTDKDYLSIDIMHSTDDFYKVITSNGLEGYCVKEFVKID